MFRYYRHGRHWQLTRAACDVTKPGSGISGGFVHLESFSNQMCIIESCVPRAMERDKVCGDFSLAAPSFVDFFVHSHVALMPDQIVPLVSFRFSCMVRVSMDHWQRPSPRNAHRLSTVSSPIGRNRQALPLFLPYSHKPSVDPF